jgi:hypothetical protein
MFTHQKKLNELQISLLKSFQCLDAKEKIEEIDSLMNFYLEKKLNEAIDFEEAKQNYTADTNNEWLLREEMIQQTIYQ